MERDKEVRMKVSLSTPCRHILRAEIEVRSFLTSELGGGECQLNVPAALPPGKNPGTSWIGCYLGPIAGMNDFWRKENLFYMLGFEPQTAQAVACCCTAYDIPASELRTEMLIKAAKNLFCQMIRLFDYGPCPTWYSPHCTIAHSGPRPLRYRCFMITLRHTTLNRTPPDEWSVRRRDIPLTTHNTHNRQTSMSWWDSNPRFQEASDCRPTP
jgi:hypothetical protein